MKALVTTLILAVGLALAPAAASAARDPRVPALQRQVATLTQQVTTLTTRVAYNEDWMRCNGAYQVKFNIAVIDLFALMLGEPQYNGPGPNDGGACARIGQPTPLRYLGLTDSDEPYVRDEIANAVSVVQVPWRGPR